MLEYLINLPAQTLISPSIPTVQTLVPLYTRHVRPSAWANLLPSTDISFILEYIRNKGH